VQADIVELVEKIAGLRAKRDFMAAQYDDQIAVLRDQLSGMMQAASLTMVRGPHNSASIRTVKDAKVADWSKLLVYITQHGAYDLLQKRLSVSNAVARMNAGEKLPAVEVEEHSELVIRAIKEEGND